MGHDHDYWEGWRRHIIPRLGVFVQLLNELLRVDMYVSSRSRRNQFVGRIQMNEERFEQYLHEWGFERNPLSSLKTRLDTGEVEEGSWRKIYPHNAPEWQLHVIIYDGEQIANAKSGELFLYAHWEYRWDVHPWKHYKGVDIDEKEGVIRMRQLLDKDGIPYEFIQP